MGCVIRRRIEHRRSDVDACGQRNGVPWKCRSALTVWTTSIIACCELDSSSRMAASTGVL
eukprot:3279805-Rhodomonas_salina.1